MRNEISLDRLLDARDRLAALVADERYEFVPFLKRIENEISLLQDWNDTVARARAIVNARNTTAAA